MEMQVFNRSLRNSRASGASSTQYQAKSNISAFKTDDYFVGN